MEIFPKEVGKAQGWDLSLTDFSEELVFSLKEIKGILHEREEIYNFINLLGRDSVKKSANKKLTFSRDNKESLTIEKTSDILRILPNELSRLHSPILRKTFYKSYIEGQLSSYVLNGAISTEDTEEKKGAFNYLYRQFFQYEG